MALTVTTRGTGGNTTGATSVTVSPNATIAVGKMAVIFIAHDNTGTNGADPWSAASDNAGGNTWTSRQAVLNDPGAANAGVAGRILTCNVATQLTTSTVITINFGAFSVPSKAIQILEVSGSAGVPTFKTAGAAGGQIPASNTLPSIVTGSITSGSALLAWFREGNAAPSVVDSDTSDGSWSSLWGTGVGSAATGIEVRGQDKVVTGTNTQTFNHTFAAGRDTVGGWIEIEEVVSGTTVTPTTLAVVTAPFAPTVNISNNQRVTPTTLATVTATFVPTVTASNHQSVTPTTASLTTATFAPTIRFGINVVPTTASLATGTFAPTVSLSDNQSVTPTTASLTTSTFAPTISVSDHQRVAPTTASLTSEAFAPTVAITDHQVVIPGTASLTTAAFAPTVTSSDHQTVVPSPASLSLTAFIPDVIFPDPQLVTPTTASLTLTGLVPQVNSGETVVIDAASLTLTTFAPTVALTDNQLITPEAAALALTSFVPNVLVTGQTVVVIPATASLTLTTYRPNLAPTPGASGSIRGTGMSATIGVSGAGAAIHPNDPMHGTIEST